MRSINDFVAAPAKQSKANSQLLKSMFREMMSQPVEFTWGGMGRTERESRKFFSGYPPKQASCISLKRQIWFLAKSELQSPSRTKQKSRGRDIFEKQEGILATITGGLVSHCALGIHLLSSRTSSSFSTPI